MSRPSLVLLHGWGFGREVWQALIKALDGRIETHCIDLPGYGATASGPEDFFATAQHLAESLPDKAILCGWSLGSLLALTIARLTPQRVARLVLVGSTPAFTQHPDWRPAQPVDVLEGFVSAVGEDPAGTLKRFFGLVNQGDSEARAISRQWARPILAAPLPETSTLVTGLGWLRDIDLRNEIAGLATSSLLIHGRNDPLMPLAAAEWLQRRLPDSRLEIFDDAAHAPFLHDPARFADLLVAYS